ncbi:ABC transporter substrate-binding protein [Streptococcus marmotae]|uniref:ABC transporter substrate-binding protein n=1 Tax=Streptococcus marmotae TaxID=1825069 RepID=UPI00082A63B8|nr:ABC transporter substrate-binding protein [Streptococcus marmotae]
MKKKVLTGILSAVAVLALAACGASKSSQETRSSSADSTTFTYAIDGDPSSTNPINTSDRWGLTLTNFIYSPLVRVEADGSYVNELAEKYEVAADGLSITVKLRQDVKWSDGEAFTADDVLFTYAQKVKKENGNADSLYINGQPVSLEKVDDYTVKFNLPAVSAAALDNIVTETYIIPEHAYNDEPDFSVNELTNVPVGTGPYKFVEYKHGQYIKLAANENYYKGKPAVENLVLRIITSADTRKVALQTGEVDASFVLPTDIADLDQKMLTTYAYTENRVGYLGLNTSTPELKDVRVRQALLYALNKEDMDQAAYLDKEYYETPYSFLPVANPYATEKVEKYEQNLEKAKSLLTEAGVTNLKVNLGYNTSDAAQTLQATLIQEQLSQIGVTVELAGGDSTALFAELRKEGSTAYDLFLGGYIMGNDPDQYARLFKSGGGSNYFKLRSDKVDALFEKGAVELDKSKREAIYDDLQVALAEEAAIYPIVDNKKILAVNNRIEGVKEAGLVPIYTFEDPSHLKIKQ